MADFEMYFSDAEREAAGKAKDILDIRKEYNDDLKRIRNNYEASVKNWLISKNLGGLVRRKSDGKLGWLCLGLYFIDFYPKTKSGAKSKISSGYPWNIEKEFEPVKEGE